jgi:hydrogenase expression/formation protein HypD
MEVCGTHTMTVFRYGLRDLLPENVRLVSGPGCPVCVTPNGYIDKAIALARTSGVIVATFGDMIRVPGSRSSLEKESARGASVKAVYSTDDALDMARRRPGQEVVFLGIGFETTAPTVAASILEAAKQGLENYSVLCGHKTMPAVMAKLAQDSKMKIDGFLLPGHVSVITGTAPYAPLSNRCRKACVVAGFEPLDVMQAILMLIVQRKPKVEIQYRRAMSAAGNAVARRQVSKVFAACDSVWRGIGAVRDSGLRIRREFSRFDAEARFRPKVSPSREPAGCICGDVLKGIRTPPDCRLFGRACRPEHPVGACMVSSEGTCAAYYKYGRAHLKARSTAARKIPHWNRKG